LFRKRTLARYFARGFGRESSNFYAGYVLEAFHVQEIVYLNVCSKLRFERITMDERKIQFKFNALRRESPIASWGST